MNHYIGCDAHKKYSVFVTVNETGQASSAERVDHERNVYRKYLTVYRLVPRLLLKAWATGTG
jgi:hypothetical protein